MKWQHVALQTIYFQLGSDDFNYYFIQHNSVKVLVQQVRVITSKLDLTGGLIINIAAGIL